MFHFALSDDSGMIFSFEGIDGSGKSTQARLLARALRDQGREVVEVREPGGTGLGERVRALLLDPDAYITARAELLLFSAARAQLVEEVICPAIARQAVVIADRFFDSSTAYQGGGRKLNDSDWMEALHRFATSGVKPDRTYLVDLPIDQAMKRRANRDLDRMESGDQAFHHAVRDAYLTLADRAPQRIRILDGRLPIESLHEIVVKDALQRLPKRG